MKGIVMRIAILGIMSLALFAAACEAPKQTTKKTPTASSNDDNNDDDGNDFTDDDPFANPTNPTPTPSSIGPDGDNDGVADSEDCDPASSAVAATRLLDDPLSQDKGFFTTADTFKSASWNYDGTLFRQTGLDTSSPGVGELTVFNKDSAIGDVTVEVSAQSTEISGAFTGGQIHRQLLVTLGTKVNAGQVDAVGCGFELIGSPAIRQTTIVRLSGTANAMQSSPIQSAAQTPLAIDEQLKIVATLKAGTLTCDVVRGVNKVTATATGLTGLSGSVGLYMRQNKGAFRSMKICKAKV